MLFNSFVFIFAYLPITFFVFFFIARHHAPTAAGWLALASLFFYGWWSPAYVPLLLASITCNFYLGNKIGKTSHPTRKRWLIFAITANLLLLGYYKYTNFFIDALNTVSDTHLYIQEIILPLGISFFTFTQIAYLVDTYYDKVKEYRFIHYALFVTYFPHLIAGPVLHHKEMMPQFSQKKTYRPDYENIAIGLTILTIGLCKKVLIADNIAPYVNIAFTPNTAPTFFEAWSGALAYTLQLYFDFSGYSDMAIGLSRLFGIKLPLNFASPYQAVNIIEFWRRWHMTLSRFLRDYLYIPLGGNKKGFISRYRNLLITMLLGGLWHGAGWTYVIWGGLHGIYLVINHAFRYVKEKILGQRKPSSIGKFLSWAITFLAVVVAWVFFRAPDVPTAYTILKGMAGINGITLPMGWANKYGDLSTWLQTQGVLFTAVTKPEWVTQIMYTFMGLLIALLCPNTQQIMSRYEPALDAETDNANAAWKPSFAWAMVVSIAFVICVINLNRVSEFLYFQF